MSTWLRPPQVFEHPAVEYIPIHVQTIGAWWAPAVAAAGHKLVVAEHPRHLQDLLVRLGVDAALPAIDWSRDLVVLALNVAAGECYYRDFKATLLGAAQPGTAQLFMLNTERVYKDSLQLVLYDAAGETVAATTTPVPGRWPAAGAREFHDTER